MTKISNQYSLTNILTADLANSRLGINNVSPTVALDVTGAGKFSSALTGTTATFSGQFSIGTTAPSWGAFTNMLNLQGGSIGGTSTTDFRIFQNMYYDGGSYRTRVLGASQRWDMADGALYIYSAASAAANAVVTPTNKFTLLNNGNCGIGTDSPKSYGALTIGGQTIGLSNIAVDINQAFKFNNYYSSSAGSDKTISTGYAGSVGFDNSVGALTFSTSSSSVAADGNIVTSERMRILANGNIGIRTTTPQGKLHVVTTGSSFTPTDTGFMGGNNNYRVHIQSTEPGLMLSSDVNGAGSATGTQTYQLGLQIGWLGTNDIRNNIYFGGALLSFVYSANQGTSGSERMRISTNGSIGAPNGTNIYNASDARLKKNINTTTYGLDAISELNPVKFNWVDGFEPSENGKDMLGFIAQEMQNVIPEAIESFGGNSITIGDTIIDNPLRVNEKFIIPVLVKAIQELSAKVSLLENK